MAAGLQTNVIRAIVNQNKFFLNAFDKIFGIIRPIQIDKIVYLF